MIIQSSALSFPHRALARGLWGTARSTSIILTTASPGMTLLIPPTLPHTRQVTAVKKEIWKTMHSPLREQTHPYWKNFIHHWNRTLDTSPEITDSPKILQTPSLPHTQQTGLEIRPTGLLSLSSLQPSNPLWSSIHGSFHIKMYSTQLFLLPFILTKFVVLCVVFCWYTCIRLTKYFGQLSGKFVEKNWILRQRRLAIRINIFTFEAISNACITESTLSRLLELFIHALADGVELDERRAFIDLTCSCRTYHVKTVSSLDL